MPIMACRMPSTVTSRCLRLPHVTLESTAALPEIDPRRAVDAAATLTCVAPVAAARTLRTSTMYVADWWRGSAQAVVACQCCDRKNLRRHSRRTCELFPSPRRRRDVPGEMTAIFSVITSAGPNLCRWRSAYPTDFRAT